MKGLSKGFTIFEVLMVIIVMGIFAMITIPQFLDFRDDAKTFVTKEKLETMKKAISGDSRHVSNGTYTNLGFEMNLDVLPVSLNDLVTQGAYLDYNPFTKKGWRGPYLSNTDVDWDKDAWGNNIIYNSGTRELSSSGPDGTSGNADDLVVNF